MKTRAISSEQQQGVIKRRTRRSTTRRHTDELTEVYVEPTTNCNLTCSTCMRNGWEEPIGNMDGTVFRNLLDGLGNFPNARTIAFAGLGEPLFHPLFVEMVQLAHGRGFRTEVTSNGLLLTPDVARDLVKEGLDQFVVSIDGASDATYGGIRSGASLDQVIANVRRLLPRDRPLESSPVRIGIEFVAMKRNVHDLPDLSWIAAAIGASFILVSNVVPYTAELENEILYDLRATSFEHEGAPLTPAWILPKMDWNDDTQGPLSRVFRGQPTVRFLDIGLEQRNNYCPFGRAGSVSVAWHGGVSPCPSLMHSHTCYYRGRKKLVRRYEIGRIPDRSLPALWEDADFSAFRRRVREFAFPPCVDCGGCDVIEGNEEDCWGNPFPVCGDCLWARGVIRCT